MDFPKDEKLSRKVLGLAASGSDYLCTYCTASRSDAAEHPIVGNYGLTPTNRLLREAASYLQVNPEKESKSASLVFAWCETDALNINRTLQ